jgi:hypothetical protein
MTPTDRPPPRCPRWLFLALLLSAAGCSKSAGEVSGKVTLNGKPLKGGTVTFIAATGTGASAGISPDGTYKALKVPLGDVKVIVVGPVFKMDLPAGGAAGGDTFKLPTKPSEGPPPADQIVPKKYADPDSSGLALTVQKGGQEFDIPLTGEEKAPGKFTLPPAPKGPTPNTKPGLPGLGKPPGPNK